MKRTIWFKGATVQQLRVQLTDDSWLGFDEDGSHSTVRVVTPGPEGAAPVTYDALNEAYLCPPNVGCPK